MPRARVMRPSRLLFPGPLDVLFEEVIQERANGGDCGQLADVLPGRGHHGVDDVRGQLELQAEEQPHPEALPDRLALAMGHARRNEDPQQADERLDRAIGDDRDRHRVDDQRRDSREVEEHVLHGAYWRATRLTTPRSRKYGTTASSSPTSIASKG